MWSIKKKDFWHCKRNHLFVSYEFVTNFPVLIFFVPNLINFGFFEWQLLKKSHIWILVSNSQSHIREIADKKTAYNEARLYYIVFGHSAILNMLSKLNHYYRWQQQQQQQQYQHQQPQPQLQKQQQQRCLPVLLFSDIKGIEVRMYFIYCIFYCRTFLFYF